MDKSASFNRPRQQISDSYPSRGPVENAGRRSFLLPRNYSNSSLRSEIEKKGSIRFLLGEVPLWKENLCSIQLSFDESYEIGEKHKQLFSLAYSSLNKRCQYGRNIHWEGKSIWSCEMKKFYLTDA